jgi:CubicO group peptidase (beta-lactamase class C family)
MKMKPLHAFRKFLVLLSCGVLNVFTAPAQQPLTQQIDSLFTALHADNKFNGNVLIAEKGKPVYEKSFGYADFRSKRPLSTASVFELASCSKQFTAFAIALLEQQKKLNYTDNITRFLPGLSAYKGITVGQLVHHTSGLPDYMQLFDSLWDKSKIANNDDLVSMLVRYHPALEFESGTRYEYSNTGYALLASIIEKASGKSYAAYLEQNIFKPLKMTHTLVYNRRYKPAKVANYAYDFFYDDENSRFVSSDSIPELRMLYYLDGISGDGTVNTTARDMLLWDRALYTDRLLPKEKRDILFTPGKLKDGTATTYAFGWMVEDNKDLGRVSGHSGGWGGYRTYIERQMDKDRTIILLQNTNRATMPLKSLRLLLEGKPLPPVAKREEVKLDDATLEQYTGTYELTPDFLLTVTRQGNQLYTQATGQGVLPIFPESERKFFLKVVDAQLEFVKDEKNVVVKAILYQGGAAMPAPKIR